METIHLSNSRIQAIGGCERAFYYGTVAGLKKKEEPEYFRIGTAVHEIIEALHGQKALPDPMPDDALIKSMIAEYVYMIEREAEPLYVDGVEVPFCIEMPQGINYVGVKDKVGTYRGKRCVCDNKTTAATRETWESNMFFSHQPVGYAFSEYAETGERCDLFLYDVMKKEIPKVPATVKSGALSWAKIASSERVLNDFFADGNHGLTDIQVEEFKAKMLSQFAWRTERPISNDEVHAWHNNVLVAGQRYRHLLSLPNDPEAYLMSVGYSCHRCMYAGICYGFGSSDDFEEHGHSDLPHEYAERLKKGEK